MELPASKVITHQATMAARNRMDSIKTAVNNQFPGWSHEAKATLIVGYMTASAEYEIALYLRELCEGIDGLHAELQSLSIKVE